VSFPTGHDPRQTFAISGQIQGAFDQIFRDIIGSSMPAARLRAAVWQSVFTHECGATGARSTRAWASSPH